LQWEEREVGFPDRIERSVDLAHPPSEVWAALTTADGLSAWFGDQARIEPHPGGAGRMTFASGVNVEMRVHRAEEPRVFAFTWQIPDLPDDDPRRTYVEFTLEARSGGTRLQVVETGFAQLPEDIRRRTHDSHVQGWAHELGELADYLDAP
jgi:uncharacterized protein YndB with AHSA1/START domain